MPFSLIYVQFAILLFVIHLNGFGIHLFAWKKILLLVVGIYCYIIYCLHNNIIWTVGSTTGYKISSDQLWKVSKNEHYTTGQFSCTLCPSRRCSCIISISNCGIDCAVILHHWLYSRPDYIFFRRVLLCDLLAQSSLWKQMRQVIRRELSPDANRGMSEEESLVDTADKFYTYEKEFVTAIPERKRRSHTT